MHLSLCDLMTRILHTDKQCEPDRDDKIEIGRTSIESHYKPSLYAICVCACICDWLPIILPPFLCVSFLFQFKIVLLCEQTASNVTRTAYIEIFNVKLHLFGFDILFHRFSSPVPRGPTAAIRCFFFCCVARFVFIWSIHYVYMHALHSSPMFAR